MTALDNEQLTTWLELLEQPAPQDGESDEVLRQRVAGAFSATATALREEGVSDRVRKLTRENRRLLELAATAIGNIEAPGYGAVAVEVAEVRRLINLMLRGMAEVG